MTGYWAEEPGPSGLRRLKVRNRLWSLRLRRKTPGRAVVRWVSAKHQHRMYGRPKGAGSREKSQNQAGGRQAHGPWEVRRRRRRRRRRRPRRPARSRPAAPSLPPRRAGIPPPPGPAQDGGPAATAQPVPSPAPWSLSATRAGLAIPDPAPPEWGGAGRAGGPLPDAAQGGRGRGALTVNGADRPDWGPEEEETEEEEKEEHETLHSGDDGGSHCGARSWATGRGGGGFCRSRRAASWVGSGSASACPGSRSSRQRGRRARACAPRCRPSKAAAPRYVRVAATAGAWAGVRRRCGCRSARQQPEAVVPKSGPHHILRRGNVRSGASLCVTASSQESLKREAPFKMTYSTRGAKK